MIHVPAQLATAYDHQWLGPFTTPHGVTFDGEGMSEVDVFLHLFTQDVIDLLVLETNRYAAAAQYFELNPPESLPLHASGRTLTRMK